MRYCILNGILLLSQLVNGQIEPSFEQYHFNQLIFNPAYAGQRGDLEIATFGRRQWVDIDDAPSTESVTVNTQLANGKIGLAGKLLHDNVGVSDKYTFALDYAYRMYTGNGVLAIGLELAASQYNLNYSKLDAFQNGDPAFTGVPEQLHSFNAGAGIWFQNDVWFAGASVPQLIAYNDNIAAGVDSVLNNLNLFDQQRNYFVTTGVLIWAGDNLSFKPYVLARYDGATPVVIDNTLSLIFADAFWLGGTYRTDGSISIMAQYLLDAGNSLQDQWMGIGYAYNQRLDAFSSVFGPTHELFVSFHLDKRTTRFTSPRFF